MGVGVAGRKVKSERSVPPKPEESCSSSCPSFAAKSPEAKAKPDTRGVGVALAMVGLSSTRERFRRNSSTLRVDSTFAARAATCQRLAESSVTIEYVHAALNVVPLGSDV